MIKKLISPTFISILLVIGILLIALLISSYNNEQLPSKRSTVNISASF
ncbi:MAG: hypothetical protein J0L62_12970 [Bacteroidetes bacterium]|nr:hypothetical protein [Bacteroidota bacterium]